VTLALSRMVTLALTVTATVPLALMLTLTLTVTCASSSGLGAVQSTLAGLMSRWATPTWVGLGPGLGLAHPNANAYPN
jgi:hypothetical protein